MPYCGCAYIPLTILGLPAKETCAPLTQAWNQSYKWMCWTRDRSGIIYVLAPAPLKLQHAKIPPRSGNLITAQVSLHLYFGQITHSKWNALDLHLNQFQYYLALNLWKVTVNIEDDLFWKTGTDITWSPYDGNMYKLFTERLTFSAAQTVCREDGSHLAKILNAQQEKFLKNYIQKFVSKYSTYNSNKIYKWNFDS